MVQSIPMPYRILLLLSAMLSLILGAEAGLMRLGWNLPLHSANFADWHGPLMICGFLGTVISLERAVALRRRWAFMSPLFAALGSLALISGASWLIGSGLILLASIILVSASAVIFWCQRALFTFMLLLGTACWLIGNLLWASGLPIYQIIPWWIGFLVITIAGERLELTRMLPPSTYSQRIFVCIVVLFLIGSIFTTFIQIGNVSLVAAALAALALWLLRNDIARKTIRQQGLTRFIAACLLTGYIWLLLGGLIGIWSSYLQPGSSYDAFLHTVLVGFVFSMIFGHAPVIFPAVSKIKIPYHPAFYLPLALLHLSLFARIAGDLFSIPHCRQIGSAGNVLAIVLFILTIITIVLRENLHKRTHSLL